MDSCRSHFWVTWMSFHLTEAPNTILSALFQCEKQWHAGRKAVKTFACLSYLVCHYDFFPQKCSIVLIKMIQFSSFLSPSPLKIPDFFLKFNCWIQDASYAQSHLRMLHTGPWLASRLVVMSTDPAHTYTSKRFKVATEKLSPLSRQQQHHSVLVSSPDSVTEGSSYLIWGWGTTITSAGRYLCPP